MGRFHSGEVYIQQQFAMAESMATVGEKVIRDFMPGQHRDFFASLPFVLVGSVDQELQPVASILTGVPGFISTPDEKSMRIGAQPLLFDPLGENLQLNSPLAILGIQPHTKRRNRMNGWVIEKSDKDFLLEVQQSFGNCPKYIVERELIYSADDSEMRMHEATRLSLVQMNLIAAADTFFIASSHPHALNPQSPDQSVDISHRGGLPGFIHVTETTLRFPDFQGNYFFNSLGNLHLNPKAGLLFFDFHQKNMLQLEVTIERKMAGALEKNHGIQAWCDCKLLRSRFYPEALSLAVVK